jgi:hypothetical protein
MAFTVSTSRHEARVESSERSHLLGSSWPGGRGRVERGANAIQVGAPDDELRINIPCERTLDRTRAPALDYTASRVRSDDRCVRPLLLDAHLPGDFTF